MGLIPQKAVRNTQKFCKEILYVYTICYYIFQFGYGKNKRDSKNLVIKREIFDFDLRFFIFAVTQNLCW